VERFRVAAISAPASYLTTSHPDHDRTCLNIPGSVLDASLGPCYKVADANCDSRVWRTTQSIVSQSNHPVATQSANSGTKIYPALLARARTVYAEHEAVCKQLLEDYDVSNAKKAGELAPIASALKRWETANVVCFGLQHIQKHTDGLQKSLTELRSLIDDPSTESELRELASDDLESTSKQLHEATQSLTKSLVPKHPFESLPCLLEIRPGVGGSEAALFAGDLLQMYQAYCSERGMRTIIIKLDRVDDGGGIAEAILEVDSANAYGILRCEAGVHRVQRVPATETKGRTHTSSASVMVLPSFPSQSDETASINFDDPTSDYFVDPKEVRLDVMRASGAGGQHVNKTESAVRLTHIPTNIVVAIQESRSQIQNKEKAWQVLRSRLAQQRREARDEEMVRLRRSVVGVAKTGRGDKIRTYNFQQQRITDHRSGMTVHGIEGFLAGGVNLEKIMVSVREWLTEREVEDMIVSAESG
jgi:peptide chain release factor 1